ncbi:uncharacterized protein [Nicotiana sylvestris]|uniref:Uncharacterized protein LOC104234137 n=1 Tax=Nicotiana sylvestris TaxID=4096 RepID=A0A1U7X8G3_NICSY|nr:PREDICTED: uncharacterized protein LOC104234137 [Nicotiana sylvestris]XP_009785941.1 PREDICTED: uncharacterized protein LOC104234137 [Nicotiana sylvestris]XP_009785942.1 PREDICTED: uncharacterized protein LOC104234137 [Nicotiana sylvestris]XP_009785943.1 PREDICTED: uncharacterized protein LOC104234137 [Nicotiana sylvestris]XP_009785944.1 PREDICTED: uncharacterized protein LOC104234137 [Nicotiana sylvestris]XP_009785945.1 PREDICTED: uncharacterized protein LOC104234137 [Nicotiana sylvestris]
MIFVMFDNQLTVPCMLSACRHNQLISRGILDYLCKLGCAELLFTLHQFPPDHSGLDFPFDPGSSLPSTYVGATRNFVFTQWNACTVPLNLALQYIATVCRWVITNSVGSNVLIGIAIHGFHIDIDDVVALDEQGAYGEWPLGLPTKDSLVADDKRNNIAAYIHLMVRVWSFFINLPKNALDIKEDERLGMAKNLRWLRGIFTDEDVYFYVLLFELPTISYISHKLDELLFHFKKILKTFLMVSSSRHSWCAIDSFLIKALVHSYFLYYESITVATFQLHLPRISEAGDGMKKNGYYGSHSWDYTTLCEEHQIWNPNVEIAFICEKLQLVYHFLIIKLSTQNILSNHGAIIKLHQFPLVSSATMYIVSLGGIVLLNCVWDPGINSKTMNLYVHTETSEAQLLLGSRGNFCFCVYSDSMTKVWDPGRQRDISSHSTDLAKGRVKYGIYHLTYLALI